MTQKAEKEESMAEKKGPMTEKEGKGRVNDIPVSESQKKHMHHYCSFHSRP